MCVWAGMAEYVDDGLEAIPTGQEGVVVMAFYAIAICVFMAWRTFRARSVTQCAAYVLAAIAFYVWPTMGGLVLLAVVTVFVVLLGISRR